MAVGTVDCYLLGDWEFYSVLYSCKVTYLLFASWLLSSKFVTWESDDLKRSILTFIGVNLNHLFVVLVSQPSLARHVNEKDSLFISANFGEKLCGTCLFQKESYRNVEYRVVLTLPDVVLVFFRDGFESHGTHNIVKLN